MFTLLYKQEFNINQKAKIVEFINKNFKAFGFTAGSTYGVNISHLLGFDAVVYVQVNN